MTRTIYNIVVITRKM